ncbi:hypothetical protein [Thermoflexibacter ruber]|uniref:hypothetical protein n=1 Tax=Thermoflexibacter ruber TaxID=1003 RepID=UPI0015A675C4|nr:hypothetical protein [Thermoflexibacter ruber]
MFAKRRADVRNLGFGAFYKLCACGNGSATKPALHKCFFVRRYLETPKFKPKT